MSKKDKIYCSSKCGIRKANRDRRKRIKETDPEKYNKELKKGKERATKSYEKSIKKRLGKKVIIGKESKKKR